MPVTMDEMGPMVDAAINGTAVRLLADSGAFYSLLSPGSAQSLHLTLSATPTGFSMRGINGTASVSLATVKTFTLAGVDLHHIQFFVGGSEGRGAGVIGQNIFGVGDVEYDLPHGAIRLFKDQGCARSNLAYWASNRAYSMIAIEPRSPQMPHTIGTVSVNGKPVRATFDTGASTSILSLAAAARAGIRPDSPGVTDGGTVFGFGHKLVRTWIAPVQSFSVGDGEQIQHARIRFGAMEAVTDMLLGADFFIAHRVYVDNREHRLFLTYEGGPVFNLKAHYQGPDPAGETRTAPPTSAPVPNAEASAASRDGAIAMARNDPETAAIAFTKAVTLSPTKAQYFDQRAEAYFRQGKVDLARADIDEAIALQPHDATARLTRAGLRLRDHDSGGAIADLDSVDQSTDAAAMERLELGGLLTKAGQPARAIGVFDQWIRAHPDDVRKPVALNGRCWARALVGEDLGAALHDCDAALRARPGAAEILDSRGMVHLRRGELDQAIADYDAALARQPRLAWSLYGRGIAKLRRNDANAGKADIDASEKILPTIAADARRLGIAETSQ